MDAGRGEQPPGCGSEQGLRAVGREARPDALTGFELELEGSEGANGRA